MKILSSKNKIFLTFTLTFFYFLPSTSISKEISPVFFTNSDSQIIIKSDQQSNDSLMGIMTANGRVRITFPTRDIVARCRQAQYFAVEELIVLSGNVEMLLDQTHYISADRLVYNINEDQIIADSTPDSKVLSGFSMYPNSAFVDSIEP